MDQNKLSVRDACVKSWDPWIELSFIFLRYVHMVKLPSVEKEVDVGQLDTI